MYTPDLLTMTDGTPVTSSAQWEARRGELLNILAREQYGTFLPPSTASAQVMAPPMPACAGHAMQETLEVRFDTPAGEFAFPLRFLYPADGQAHPLFLLLNFRPLIPDIYCPAEEILDNGFALAVVCYTDITADDGDWGSGLCGHYPRKHPDTDPGKLVFWAYAASRALDVLTLRPEVDARNIAVIGHSRLGKAALLCGAQDTRIRFTCANDAGCGGDALEQTKHPGAEDYAAMARSFPYWFCGNRSRYIDHPEERPYDQHFLLGAIAPRFAAVSSASLDRWADPYSQQLCCAAASPAWKLHGLAVLYGFRSSAQGGNGMKTLCVDLGGSRVKLALMTADSHPQPDVFEVDSRAPLAQTLSLVAQHAAAWGQPDAVSIALPCVVCRGTVIACNGKYTDAVGFDWMRWSQKTFGAPVFLMNDAAAALLGEMRCGAAKDTAAAAILMIGTGIGSAAAHDRRILTGRHGTMGMLGGHMAIEMLHPRRCTCGATGCLEAWAGTWALDEIARQEDGFAESALANAKKVDYRVLLDGVAQGDAVSLRVFETVATALGMGAVNLIHAYDPEVLLLSGGPCHSEMLMQRIRRYVRENVWTPWGQIDIRVAENPERSVLLGLIRE